MLMKLLLVLAAALAALLVYAATRPDTFRIERSTLIQAPVGKIFPFLDNPREANRWNPFIRRDPGLKGTYSGPASGPGATFEFDGNKDVGKGRVTVLSTQPPERVTVQLDMSAPMTVHNTVEYTLQRDGNATRVTWSMHGPASFVSKLVGVFINVDRMIGNDFEAGLASLKRLAEGK